MKKVRESEVLAIIADRKKEYHEKRAGLAYLAENLLPYPELSDAAKNYLEKRVICDIFEGAAPYRPRYILPDYEKLLKNGSEYLDLPPAEDFYDAVGLLMAAYRFVPSITGYPVYIGGLDELLQPFAHTVSAHERYKLLHLLLQHVGKVYPDGFVHANIGPRATDVGFDILKIERELEQAVPNLTMKVAETTDEEFLLEAVRTALAISKPYFANHEANSIAWGTPKYGIASCYNALLIGGGSHSLVRLNLKELGVKARDEGDFMNAVLPDAMSALCEVLNARIRFLVEESGFFANSWLVREGLIDLNRFTAMAGLFGLYDCVEQLCGEKMGCSDVADSLAEDIIRRFRELLTAHKGVYCKGTFGTFGMHAQSGIDSDDDVTPGTRIRIGEEVEIYRQIILQGKLHKYFDAGVSDIYVFEKTAKDNPQALVKIIRGAMQTGLKLLSVGSSDAELVRVTGYLVKRSDLEKWRKGQSVREDTVALANNAEKNVRFMERKKY